jgi:DNA-directed RNA polymerase specialized sigma24 family protein
MRGRIVSDEHFFQLSARAMRQVLIDHARARGKWIRVEPESLPELFHAMWRSELDVDLALDLKVTFERLRAIDPVAAQVIWLHYSEGRTMEDTAASLGRTLARVRTDREFGLKWMADQLRKES